MPAPLVALRVVLEAVVPDDAFLVAAAAQEHATVGAGVSGGGAGAAQTADLKKNLAVLEP